MMGVSGLYGLNPHTRDTSSDAVHRRPHGTDMRRWRTHGFFCPASFINTRLLDVHTG